MLQAHCSLCLDRASGCGEKQHLYIVFVTFFCRAILCTSTFVFATLGFQVAMFDSERVSQKNAYDTTIYCKYIPLYPINISSIGIHYIPTISLLYHHFSRLNPNKTISNRCFAMFSSWFSNQNLNLSVPTPQTPHCLLAMPGDTQTAALRGSWKPLLDRE